MSPPGWSRSVDISVSRSALRMIVVGVHEVTSASVSVSETTYLGVPLIQSANLPAANRSSGPSGVHLRLFGGRGGGRVSQDHHTRAERLGADELQRGFLSTLGEQALPAADHEGVDPDPVLVDQVVFHQG